MKIDNELVLKIKVPIDYRKFRNVLKGNVWMFQSTKKEKDINIQISINSLNSYIEFLFNGFDKNIYVESGYLYIVLENIQEITHNKTPYKKMKENIKIKRIIKNNLGYLYLTLVLDKELVFSSVYQLFKNKQEKSILKDKTKLKHKIPTSTSTNIERNQKTIKDTYVKAVVLSHNRECIINEHNIEDVKAIIKIVQKKW